MIEFRPAIAGFPADPNNDLYLLWKGLKIGYHLPNLAAAGKIAKNFAIIFLAHDPLSQAVALQRIVALPLPANKMSIVGTSVGQQESFIVDVRKSSE